MLLPEVQLYKSILMSASNDVDVASTIDDLFTRSTLQGVWTQHNIHEPQKFSRKDAASMSEQKGNLRSVQVGENEYLARLP